MSYEIKIYNPKQLNQRAYIYINIHGKRLKEYNGNKIGINIKPNLAKTYRKSTAMLNDLYFAFKTAIDNGNYPKEVEKTALTTTYVLNDALKQKQRLGLSAKYIKSLESVLKAFMLFLNDEDKKGEINGISINRIQEFLLQYNSSNTNYMNQRRNLGILFSQVAKQFEITVPNVKNTNRIKVKPNLHRIYTDNQLTEVFNFLKRNHYNLYLCSLITYGCLLRPHQEVRKLTFGHFKNHCSEIHLSAKENKSGRVRVVYVPDYVKAEIFPLIKEETHSNNIFSHCTIPFNEYYFSTAWKRMWKEMFQIGIIEEQQTLYSFRHTSAVNIYRRTKDLHLLQQIMSHSDMVVTQKYLRGLGVHDNEEIKHVIPQLELG